MRIVAALGGNALLQRDQSPGADTQRANIRLASRPLAALAGVHELVITHGNGPQVGLLALQSEALQTSSGGEIPGYPLDILDAQSEGMLGYLIEQELANLLPERQVATLLTRVEVAYDDPAFAAPDKPIGPRYSASQAQELAKRRGWQVAADGDRFRRVVASPRPLRILELASIRLLLEAGQIVVCAGGGGIPVIRAESGAVYGVEAIIDKDHASGLLARELDADLLLLLTDVPAVWTAWPCAQGQAIRCASPAALAPLHFEPGSMAPKVAAASEFVSATGKPAAIGALAQAERIVAGEAGTRVQTDGALETYPHDQRPHA